MTATRLRKWLLWGALAATLCSAILAPSEESPRRDARAAAQPAAANSRVAAAAAPVARAADAAMEPTVLVRPVREADTGPVINLFDSRLPPAPPPAPPPKPTAPPLPFLYMGSITEGGQVKVYLVQGATVFEAAAGAAFTPSYRLDAIGADALTITYLPLNMQQSLPMGGAR